LDKRGDTIDFGHNDMLRLSLCGRPFIAEGNMFRFIITLFLLFAVAQEANAACGSTANRAGCTTPNGAVGVGPNGAASYNKNTGAVHTTQRGNAYHTNETAAGTDVQGPHGNSATKALQSGCAFVDGRRVCK
jgi:hypothetical protein